MALAKSAPDGYTLGMGATGAIAVNPHVPGSAPLEPKRELFNPMADTNIVHIPYKGSDPALAKRISDEIGQILAQPETQEKVLSLGAETAYLGPQEFGAFIDTASGQWGELVKSVSQP